jgi:benzoyl-CoA reductase/2-hydroxyglutaryl-CoA dehydratase subunit BcrC/BadD/HgdB
MSLKSIEKIKQRLKERPAELAAERKSGKKVVGWQGYNLPEEIIHALGFIPVRIAVGGDDRLVEIGARYISTKNCVFVRETIGLFAENKDPYIQNMDVLAFDATCLQTFRTAELLQYYFNKEVFILGVPRNFYWEEAQVYFEKELGYLVSRLEEYAGVKLTKDALSASIALYNETRSTLAAIYDYQAAANPAITWLEAYDTIQAGYYLDRAEYAALLKEVLAELKEAAPNPVIEENDDEARIFISGSVIPPGDRKLIGIIESMGGRIVGDDIWTGIIPNLNVTIAEPTVPALARAYLNRTPHGALPYLDLASDRRLASLKSQIKKFRAHGVIYHTLRYCDPYTFKAKETKDVLADEGVPLLEIHTEYAGSDYEAIRTRVEAFVEMLKTRI